METSARPGTTHYGDLVRPYSRRQERFDPIAVKRGPYAMRHGDRLGRPRADGDDHEAQHVRVECGHAGQPGDRLAGEDRGRHRTAGPAGTRARPGVVPPVVVGFSAWTPD